MRYVRACQTHRTAIKNGDVSYNWSGYRKGKPITSEVMPEVSNAPCDICTTPDRFIVIN